MTRIHALLTATFIATMSLQVSASPVTVSSQDLPGHCDVLGPLPTIMDELGTAPAFPLDELISATAVVTTTDACASSSSPAIDNALLSITNLTTVSFTDLHYVTDPGTGFTNFDGVINSFEAVRLDNVGVNRPLIAEIGGSLPLVFEPGETWQVILDDWNAGGPSAADLGSIGVPSSVVPDPSTGSIVAIPVPVPEPATVSLLTIIGLGLLIRHRRRQP